MSILPPPMFVQSDVIQLNDDHFYFRKAKNSNNITCKIKNPEFKGKYGYIMIYSPSCPHCRTKEDFWSYLGTQFNVNPDFADENFRIGVINGEDPNSAKIISALNVIAVPRFMHVLPSGQLTDYRGVDISPESLIREVCDMSSDDTLCNLDSSLLDFGTIIN
jgi:hypothetical protein